MVEKQKGRQEGRVAVHLHGRDVDSESSLHSWHDDTFSTTDHTSTLNNSAFAEWFVLCTNVYCSLLCFLNHRLVQQGCWVWLMMVSDGNRCLDHLWGGHKTWATLSSYVFLTASNWRKSAPCDRAQLWLNQSAERRMSWDAFDFGESGGTLWTLQTRPFTCLV